MSKYVIDYLQPAPAKDHKPIGTADKYADALTEAETWCEQWDEQLFIGIWLDEHLVAIFDSNGWFTK